MHGERIEALPVPAAAAQRMAESVMQVLSDGTVPGHAGDVTGERTIGDAGKDGIRAVWAKAAHRAREHGRPAQVIEPSPARGEAWVHGGRSRVAFPDTGL